MLGSMKRKVVYEYHLENMDDERLMHVGSSFGVSRNWLPLADSIVRGDTLTIEVGATRECWVCGALDIPMRSRKINFRLFDDPCAKTNPQQGRLLTGQREPFRLALLGALLDRYPWTATFARPFEDHCLILKPDRLIYLWQGHCVNEECIH